MKAYLNLVAFSHTIFAFPFALIMLAVLYPNLPARIDFYLSIVVALVAARTAAMAFNRIVDLRFDSLNPRTAQRELPRGAISKRSAVLFCASAAIIFLIASAQVGAHCLPLAPLVLIVLAGYSFTKRFTHYAHLVLGFCLALAPGGVWYAVTATWSMQPVSLMVAVMLWVAGFDMLYALQDDDFDRAQGLHSIPSLFGERAARVLSVLFHLSAIVALYVFGKSFGLGTFFYTGVVMFSIALSMQHIRFSRESVGPRFFIANGLASSTLLLFTLLDRWHSL